MRRRGGRLRGVRWRAGMNRLAMTLVALTLVTACANRCGAQSPEVVPSGGRGTDEATCFHPSRGICVRQPATDDNKAACTAGRSSPADPGRWAAHCPTANLIGCCLSPDPTQYECSYPPESGSATDPEQDCKRNGGAWITSLPSIDRESDRASARPRGGSDAAPDAAS